MDLWCYEREQWNSGIETVCGVDEAGAGPLAEPVYAAAVILPRELEIPGLNDSKQLSEKKREHLFDLIVSQAVAYSVACVEAAEIDEVDILNARMLAMQRAIDGLQVKADLALIDGNRDHGSRYAIQTPHLTIIKGDGKAPPLLRRPFWQKYPVTAIRWRNCTSSIPSISLQNTRAMVPSSIMKCWMHTALVLNIG